MAKYSMRRGPTMRKAEELQMFTAKQLSKALGVSAFNVRSSINAMKRRMMIHICGYLSNVYGGPPIAIYKWGMGVDAPMPEGEDIRSKRNYRRKLRNVLLPAATLLQKVEPLKPMDFVGQRMINGVLQENRPRT